MVTKVFINLPVKDIDKSKSFFLNIGFQFNEQISDEHAACIIIKKKVFVMLLQEDYFKTFVPKAIVNIPTSNEVIISLEAESKQEIQSIINKARNFGAHIYAEAEEYAWLYQHGFADLDGHLWEFIFTDKNLLPKK